MVLGDGAMRSLAATLALLAAGCESSPVEYDPVRDSSRLSATVCTRTPENKKYPRVDLILHLTGRGKHPASWTSSFEVTVKAIGSSEDLLGATPTLVINPGSPGQRKVQSTRQQGPKE